MIYSQILDHLPLKQMSGLAEGCQFEFEPKEGVVTQYRYVWLDLKIILNVLPKHELAEHLKGFEAFLQNAYQNRGVAVNQKLIDRIRKTRLVIGVVCEPDYAEESRFLRMQEILGTISYNSKSLVFFEGAIIDENGQHVFP